MSTLWMVDSDPGGGAVSIDLSDRCPKVLGRSHRVDVRLDDLRVSGRHAEVSWDGERSVIRDLASLNGTWLDRRGTRRRLEPNEEEVLAPGDRVQLGRYLLFPAEPVDAGILMTDFDVQDSTLGEVVTPIALPDTSGMMPVIEALERISAVRSHRDLAHAALREAAALVGAHGGYLLNLNLDRWVLLASSGVEGPAALSRSFLETARNRKEAWTARPSAIERVRPDEETALDRYPEDAVLAAVPFPGPDGGTSSVAYLVGSKLASGTELGAATLFGRIAGAMLESALSLDREQRRREAAERRERRHRRGLLGQTAAATSPIGNDPGFVAAVEAVRRAGGARSTILLRGPTGSGKEELARLAHQSGPRREHPFVALNGAALPEGLVEAELFGADRGAYTGADHARRGSFEQADGGTLFLDEIGDLSPTVQAKILRVIESGEVVRVGGSRCRVDVRLVAATHRDLEAMIREGSFREDLYFRLRVIEVRVPSLADRAGDILPLATHFLETFLRPDAQAVSSFTAAAVRALSGYHWPGNVRELRNVIERAVVVDQDGVIDVDDLPAEFRPGAESPSAAGPWRALLERPWPDARESFEQHYFQEALSRHGGRVKDAAAASGVDRRTLSTKIREHRLKKKKG